MAGTQSTNSKNRSQHNLIIYGATQFEVENLDQPQNVRATKCGKSYLPFPPSIKQNESNAWVHS